MVGVQAVCPDLVTGCNHAVIFLAFFCKISQAKITAVFNQTGSHVHSLYNLEFQPSPGFLFPEQLVDGNRQCAVDTGGYDDGHGWVRRALTVLSFCISSKHRYISSIRAKASSPSVVTFTPPCILWNRGNPNSFSAPFRMELKVVWLRYSFPAADEIERCARFQSDI